MYFNEILPFSLCLFVSFTIDLASQADALLATASPKLVYMVPIGQGGNSVC